MQPVRIVRPIATAAVALVLAGCSFGSSDTAPPPQTKQVGGDTAPSPQLAAALADGKVTFDEYDAGYRRYKACMKKAGYDIQDMGIKDQVYDYRLTDEAYKSAAQATCYKSEFQDLDAQWQVANQDNSEGARILAECLTKQGLPVPDTFEERLKVLDDNGIDAVTCDKA